jgi:hypothetical protein
LRARSGNRFDIRIEGTRIKHTMGPVSLKLYDKFSLILRIETTVNDLTFFKHYREVEHRDGTKETKWASMQKTIYSLPALARTAGSRQPPLPGVPLHHRGSPQWARQARQALAASPRPAVLIPASISSIPMTTTFFSPSLRGEFNISGLQNKSLRRFLPDKNSGQVSRLLKRLRCTA